MTNHRRPGILDTLPARHPMDVAFHAGSRALVYLIHGVTGTPTEMRYLAAGLAHRGLDVFATTLPGHCARVRDLIRTNDETWKNHILRQLESARPNYDALFVAGLSAGGSLALEAASVVRVEGIGVLSPTFIYDGWNTPWSNAILPLAMKLVPYSLQHLLFHLDGPPYGIKDPGLQAKIHAAYRLHAVFREWLHACWPIDDMPRLLHSDAEAVGNPIFPLKTLTDIDRLTQRARRLLPRLKAPIVILQAREDDMTSPRNAQLLYDEVGSSVKKIDYFDDCYHVITVDKQRKAVIRKLGEFFEAQCPAPTLLL